MTRPQDEARAGLGPDPDVIRAEAERLVAAGLAAVSMAADRIGAPTRERGGAAAASFDALGDMLFGPAGHRRHSVANDSPECCRCPVCRMIAAARQPSPTFAERLATGVGFVAGGAARVMRGVAGTSAARPAPNPSPAPPSRPAPTPWAEPDPWAAATAELPAPVESPASAQPPAPTVVATPPPAKETTKKAVKRTVKKAGAKVTGTKAGGAKAGGAKAATKRAVRPRKTTGNADQ